MRCKIYSNSLVVDCHVPGQKIAMVVHHIKLVKNSWEAIGSVQWKTPLCGGLLAWHYFKKKKKKVAELCYEPVFRVVTYLNLLLFTVGKWQLHVQDTQQAHRKKKKSSDGNIHYDSWSAPANCIKLIKYFFHLFKGLLELKFNYSSHWSALSGRLSKSLVKGLFLGRVQERRPDKA